MGNGCRTDIQKYMMDSIYARLSLAFAAALTCSISVAAPQYPVVSLQTGMHVIKAEVASTAAQRETGLMNRKKMGQNEGMLFDFERPASVCMWMKNTYIPLSVAFIAQDGTIVNIEDMQPLTENNHCSAKPIRYALEMNRGWFKQRLIKPGSKITGMP